MRTALLVALPFFFVVPVLAAPQDKGGAVAHEEVRIPFPSRGGIRNFHAVSDEVLYLQDRRRNWYKAELVGPCIGLSHAMGIGFDTRHGSVFDRFSHIVVRGERCPIASLTRSEGPPRKRKAKS